MDFFHFFVTFFNWNASLRMFFKILRSWLRPTFKLRVLGAVLALRGRGVLVLGLAPRYGGVAAWDGESGEGLAVGLG